jgi:hypothetical protein
MDHNDAVGQKATERYLLNELDPAMRDEFEEHLFDCQDCALDVRAAAMFLEQSKAILAEPPVPAPVRVPFPVPAQSRWLGWFRPALATPLFAVLLVTLGYQNLVTYPQLRAVNAPQVLPSASINFATRGSSIQVIPVTKGKGFMLSVRIPPQTGVSSYKLDLINPSEKLEWTLNLPVAPGQDSWTVQVPAQSESGKYTLQAHGVTASGQVTEIGFPAQFELQTTK